MSYPRAGDPPKDSPVQTLFDSPEVIILRHPDGELEVVLGFAGTPTVDVPVDGGVGRVRFTPAPRPVIVARLPTGRMTDALRLLFLERGLPATVEEFGERMSVLAAEEHVGVVTDFLARLDALLHPEGAK